MDKITRHAVPPRKRFRNLHVELETEDTFPVLGMKIFANARDTERIGDDYNDGGKITLPHC